MAKKKETSVEEKLRALYDLQLIDTRVDEIRNVRGELPLEVEDLENEIAGLDTRLEKFTTEVADFDLQIKAKKNDIEIAKEEHKKYAARLDKVRNNREYNSITKEQEFQELEMQLAEKKIKEFQTKIEQKNITIEELTEKIKERNKHLKGKKEELDEGGNPIISNYPIFFASQKVSFKNNRGEYLFQTDSEGQPIYDESGNPKYLSDLDSIKDEFIKWGKKERFDFL